MFHNLVVQDGIVEVIDISEKQESKARPSGLNTVNLLKVSKLCYHAHFYTNLQFRLMLLIHSNDYKLFFLIFF